MDFGAVSLDGLMGSETDFSSLALDPETSINGTKLGSSSRRDLLAPLKIWRISKLAKTDDFSASKVMMLQQRNALRRSKKNVMKTKLKDIQEFLKLPQKGLTSRQIGIHKGPLSDHLKNWEDVNRTLTGTAYESFLSSDY